MKFRFVDYKSDTTYIPLLGRLAFKYCKNRDGRIYATYSGSIINKNMVEVLIDNLTPIFINKKNAIILNLLVNPFFDDLCDYLSKNKKNINHSILKLINKHIFSYLADCFTMKVFSDPVVEGSDIYSNKNMYERSKKILKKP